MLWILKPLWCCRNARKETHECVYALCHPCKTSTMHMELNTPERRTGRSRNRNPDNDLSICSHIYHDLNPFVDKQYLDPEYVKRKIADDNSILPTNCSLCSFKIIPFKNNILL